MGVEGGGGGRVYSDGLTCLQSLDGSSVGVLLKMGFKIRFTGFKKTKNVRTFFFLFSLES